jgi:hypothetical protein
MQFVWENLVENGHLWDQDWRYREDGIWWSIQPIYYEV